MILRIYAGIIMPLLLVAKALVQIGTSPATLALVIEDFHAIPSIFFLSRREMETWRNTDNCSPCSNPLESSYSSGKVCSCHSPTC